MRSDISILQNQLTEWLLRRTPNTGARRIAPLGAAIASEIGNVREENQDRGVVVRFRTRDGGDCVILAVADGIGGMREGGTCAAVAIGSFLGALYSGSMTSKRDPQGWVRGAALAADRHVHDRFSGRGGSTLVALVANPGGPSVWLSVGDSRVYRSYERIRDLEQLSVDDTINGQLDRTYRYGEVEQSTLLQFVGMGTDLEPHVGQLLGVERAVVVLTTDGVHFLESSDHVLSKIVSNSPDAGVCVKRLVDLAKWVGGSDNATVAMIDLSEPCEPSGVTSNPRLEVWDAFGELQIFDFAFDEPKGTRNFKPQASSFESVETVTTSRRPASEGVLRETVSVTPTAKRALDSLNVKHPARRPGSKRKKRAEAGGGRSFSWNLRSHLTSRSLCISRRDTNKLEVRCQVVWHQ